MTTRATGRGRDDGFVAAELAAGVALLVLPVIVLVLSLPTWAERRTTARAIAREVGRATARSMVCDRAAARALATTMAANLGADPSAVSVTLACPDGEPLAPGSTLEVAVTVQVPAVHLPAFGDAGGWTITARHREPVDEYGAVP